MRLLLVAFLAWFIVASEARALEGPALCALVPPGISKIIGDFLKGKGTCPASCSGCGCKGGPGYRDANGCVSWAQLEKRCGPSPHKGCTKECIPVVPACFDRAATILNVVEAMRKLGKPIETVPAVPKAADAQLPR